LGGRGSAAKDQHAARRKYAITAENVGTPSSKTSFRHMPEPSLELLIAAMQTELSRLGNGIVLRLMLLLRYLSSRGSVRILVLLLLLTLLLILLPLDLVSTGGYAVVMLLRVECHDAFLSNTTG
jgi:hypothetical protein